MNYEERAIKQIKENWFNEHDTVIVKGEEGLQKIIFQKKGTSSYKVVYTFSGRNLLITGDIGSAVYNFSGGDTSLEYLCRLSLHQFNKKLVISERSKWVLDIEKAQREIKEYFLDWCDVATIEEMDVEDRTLLRECLDALLDFSDYQSFSTIGISNVYLNTDVDWFDGEAAEIISECGKELSFAVISYWVGLQMAYKLLQKGKNNDK